MLSFFRFFFNWIGSFFNTRKVFSKAVLTGDLGVIKFCLPFLNFNRKIEILKLNTENKINHKLYNVLDEAIKFSPTSSVLNIVKSILEKTSSVSDETIKYAVSRLIKERANPANSQKNDDLFQVVKQLVMKKTQLISFDYDNEEHFIKNILLSGAFSNSEIGELVELTLNGFDLNDTGFNSSKQENNDKSIISVKRLFLMTAFYPTVIEEVLPVFLQRGQNTIKESELTDLRYDNNGNVQAMIDVLLKNNIKIKLDATRIWDDVKGRSNTYRDPHRNLAERLFEENIFERIINLHKFGLKFSSAHPELDPKILAKDNASGLISIELLFENISEENIEPAIEALHKIDFNYEKTVSRYNRNFLDVLIFNYQKYPFTENTRLKGIKALYDINPRLFNKINDEGENYLLNMFGSHSILYPSVLQKLIDLNVDIHAEDNFGQNAYHLIYKNKEISANDKEKIIDFLIDHKVNANLGDKYQNTVFHYLASEKYSHKTVVDKYLDALIEANPHEKLESLLSFKNKSGKTPMQLAQESKNEDFIAIVNERIKNPRKPNRTNNSNKKVENNETFYQEVLDSKTIKAVNGLFLSEKNSIAELTNDEKNTEINLNTLLQGLKHEVEMLENKPKLIPKLSDRIPSHIANIIQCALTGIAATRHEPFNAWLYQNKNLVEGWMKLGLIRPVQIPQIKEVWKNYSSQNRPRF